MRYPTASDLPDGPPTIAQLTKREYFAALAMQGLLASGNRSFVAHDALVHADDLLAELAK